MSDYLVTGATGNVGREVVTALLAEGHEVRAVSRTSSGGDLPAGAHVIAEDLNDRRRCTTPSTARAGSS